MKKYIIAMPMIMALAVSCQQYVSEDLEGFPVTVRVNEATRVSLEGNVVKWSATDRISLSNSNNTHCVLSLTEGAETNTAVFDGKITNTPPETDTYYAFYQFTNNSVSFDGENYVSKFPMNQYSSSLAPVMVGKAEGQKADAIAMSMKNVGSYLEFSLTGNGTLNLKTIKITASETISGSFYVEDGDYSDPVPVFTGNVKNVVYTDENETLIGSQPSVFLVLVPNIAYSKGLTVDFIATDNTTISKKIGGSGIALARNKIYQIPMTFEKNAEYEWSPGNLMIDENGYGFADSDSETDEEVQGMYFQYNSSHAIEADLVVGSYDKDAIKVWYYDETTASYVSRVVRSVTGDTPVSAWSQIPANDGGDPCRRVAVAEGENHWMLPTEEQWRTWAKPGERGDQVTRGGRNGAKYVISDDHSAYIFETRYLTTSGEATQGSGWSMYWINTAEEAVAGTALSYVQFKPTAKNSATPAYKSVANAAVIASDNNTLHTQAHQIRCVRIKK